jgi:DNA-binding CsgD family transcriptional regulator
MHELSFQHSGRNSDSRAPLLTKGPDVLTRKEIECLTWCKEGKTNWEIGELVISEKTVEFHLRNATRKLGATNRITAVVAGNQNRSDCTLAAGLGPLDWLTSDAPSGVFDA